MTIISKFDLHLAILGPSGGGKGTQAKLLADKFGWRHISIGELLRREVKKGTPLGQKIQRFVLNGELAPDTLALAVLFRSLEKIIPSGFILDGVPRTLHQAKAIDDFLKSRKCPLDRVILLELADKAILERRQRVEAEGKPFQPGRDDDREDAWRRRLSFYRRNIGDIEAYYRKKGVLVLVDGNRPIKAISEDLMVKLEAYYGKQKQA